MGRFGLAVRRYAGKKKDLGSITPVVVCGHCLVTVSFTISIKMALIAAHLNAGVILVVTVWQ